LEENAINRTCEAASGALCLYPCVMRLGRLGEAFHCCPRCPAPPRVRHASSTRSKSTFCLLSKLDWRI